MYNGRYVTVQTQDVIIMFGMIPSTFTSVRSRLELMYAVYLWLDEHTDQWDSTQRVSTEWMFWNAMSTLLWRGTTARARFGRDTSAQHGRAQGDLQGRLALVQPRARDLQVFGLGTSG